jgi:hypothetical protein
MRLNVTVTVRVIHRAMPRRRNAIEDQIIRYKSLLWTATDQRTRDALFDSIRALQLELAEIEVGAGIAQAVPSSWP